VSRFGWIAFAISACAAQPVDVPAPPAPRQPPARVSTTAPPPAPVEMVAPPVELGKPSPQPLGERSVSAQPCKLDARGAVMKRTRKSGDFRALFALRVHGERVYLLDHERKLRAYRRHAASDCALALDGSFGDGGIMTVARGADDERADWFEELSVGGGAIVLSGTHAQPRVLRDGTFSERCASRGPLWVSPDGRHAAHRGRLVDADCASMAHPEGWPASLGSHQLRPFDDGVLGWRFGEEGDVTSWHAHDGAVRWVLKGAAKRAERCALGLCLLDQNRRTLWSASLDGRLLGEVKLEALLGKSPEWASDISIGPSSSYLAIDQAGADGEHYGVVYALDGLN
jgi:hypothetical protein